jgi:YD repeat-containing protein
LNQFLYISLLLINTFCNAQDLKKCTVYQFAGTDSSKKHISLVQTFNGRGQIISEAYSIYKKSSAEGIENGTYYYYYNDTLLSMRVWISYRNDTSKMICYYNSQNQLTKEEYFRCERRLKKEVQESNIDVMFDRDFEKNRTWMKVNEASFTYDEKGRIIKKTDEHDYTRSWQYDSLNRITQEKGYMYNKLAFVKGYHYFNGGYKYSTVYYDENEKPRAANHRGSKVYATYTRTFLTDEKGRIINEEIKDEKGMLMNSEVTEYDEKGRIVKTVFFDSKRVPEITHIFHYK